VAVDVGGTKLAAGRVDDGGRVLERRQVPTPRRGDGEDAMAPGRRRAEKYDVDRA